MDTLDEKVGKSIEVLEEAFERFESVVVAWTGGKDSTVLLHLAEQVRGSDLAVLFCDTSFHFDEVLRFRDEVAAGHGFNLINARNDEMLKMADGTTVQVSRLPGEYQGHVDALGWTGESFDLVRDREPCCHFLKTVPIGRAVEEGGFDAMATGIRWDEQEARGDETYFSPRTEPEHVRVHPILHFTEREVWDYIESREVPHNPMYEEGYRSLGCEPCTSPSGPGGPERGGRAQDKEDVMARLRDLGYL